METKRTMMAEKGRLETISEVSIFNPFATSMAFMPVISLIHYVHVDVSTSISVSKRCPLSALQCASCLNRIKTGNRNTRHTRVFVEEMLFLSQISMYPLRKWQIFFYV
jgi:hypothetical protein